MYLHSLIGHARVCDVGNWNHDPRTSFVCQITRLSYSFNQGLLPELSGGNHGLHDKHQCDYCYSSLQNVISDHYSCSTRILLVFRPSSMPSRHHRHGRTPHKHLLNLHLHRLPHILFLQPHNLGVRRRCHQLLILAPTTKDTIYRRLLPHRLPHCYLNCRRHPALYHWNPIPLCCRRKPNTRPRHMKLFRSKSQIR